MIHKLFYSIHNQKIELTYTRRTFSFSDNVDDDADRDRRVYEA